MSWLLILIIIIIGLLFLLLEILVVPGTTIVGIAGVVLMIFGVYSSYNHYGTAVGTYTLAGTIIFTISALVLALKSNTWKKAMLHSEIDSRVNLVEEGNIKAGDEGISISRLNPMGKALINSEYYEVTSKDNLLDQNSEIVVTKVEGNKIIVKLKTQ